VLNGAASGPPLSDTLIDFIFTGRGARILFLIDWALGHGFENPLKRLGRRWIGDDDPYDRFRTEEAAVLRGLMR